MTSPRFTNDLQIYITRKKNKEFWFDLDEARSTEINNQIGNVASIDPSGIILSG